MHVGLYRGTNRLDVWLIIKHKVSGTDYKDLGESIGETVRSPLSFCTLLKAMKTSLMICDLCDEICKSHICEVSTK